MGQSEIHITQRKNKDLEVHGDAIWQSRESTNGNNSRLKRQNKRERKKKNNERNEKRKTCLL